MLRKPDESDQANLATGRIAALDRARTFITLSVLVHHSVLNYTYFGEGDKKDWLGFDLVVLFNDSYFMALMFFISGLFVRDGLERKRPAIFLRDRAWRLGVPFLISIFLVGISLYIRLRMKESPIFEHVKSSGMTSANPLIEGPQHCHLLCIAQRHRSIAVQIVALLDHLRFCGRACLECLHQVFVVALSGRGRCQQRDAGGNMTQDR